MLPLIYGCLLPEEKAVINQQGKGFGSFWRCLMDGQAFTVFSEKFLGPQLWAGAVVVMDNLPAHKLYHFSKFMQSVAIADRI
jgi:hypothetical protein